ncbi:MAG: hypothetical protein JOY58_13510 [Solirubrobacterales bacterium]|nr:hypothetical protein [Solirubrobacterales bacterium]
MFTAGVNDGKQYGGGFYWAGGGSATYDNQTAASFGPFYSGYFGFQLVCGADPCKTGISAINVGQVNLNVQETAGPALNSPSGLWQSRGWLRGDWNLYFSGDSPSGMCGIGASINGQTVASVTSLQNVSLWHECSAPAISQTIHTWQYGNGAMPLTLSGWDAAGLPAIYTRTINIDNSQPTVSLSGPTDAPSTAGTQYVTATAQAGPAGVRGISCSVDNAPAQWYPARIAQIPVGGIGEHAIECWAANNALDANGTPAWSAPGNWTLKIGQPTVSGIGFEKIVDALRCSRGIEHVKEPPHWVTVHRGHKPVKVRRPGRIKVVKVMRCHPRTALRRVTVWVTVHRGGKSALVKRSKFVRVVLIPHTIDLSLRRVPHGRGTVVDGWLGTSSGVALGGQSVSVLSAPNNGEGHFTTVATATTAVDGSWSAKLPPGPSRLVEALYSGGPTTEASLSGQVQTIVPAEVKLISVSPRRVPWGGTVRIVGQLIGGYLPPDGALVRLRIGSGSAYTTYGVQEHVTGHGRFSTIYTFGAGLPSVHRSFWFQIASLPMGDYPYSPAASRRAPVLVGG